MAEPFCVSANICAGKKIKKEGVGLSRFSVGCFLNHNAKEFRRGTLWCFRESPVSKNLMQWKGSCYDSLSEKLLSPFTENLRRGSFSVWQTFEYLNFLCIVGGVMNFQPKFLAWQCRKISWWNPSVSEKFWYGKKFCLRRGVSRFSVESF